MPSALIFEARQFPLRGRPGERRDRRPRLPGAPVQMVEDLLDHSRGFNTGNDLHPPTTVTAGAIALFAPLVLPVMIVATKPINQTFSGTLSSTEIDVDGDAGATSAIDSFCRQGNLGGVFNTTSSAELATNPVPSGNCLKTEVEFKFISAGVVEWFTSTGGFSFMVLDSGYLCVDFPTGGVSGVVDLFIAGGTRRAEGTSGTATLTHSGQTLVPDSERRRVFVAVAGSISGNITSALTRPVNVSN